MYKDIANERYPDMTQNTMLAWRNGEMIMKFRLDWPRITLRILIRFQPGILFRMQFKCNIDGTSYIKAKYERRW